MKKILVTSLFLLILVLGCSTAQKISPEEQFKKSFPQHKYETMTKTSLQGVYEVYNGTQVYYYLPEGDVLIVGSIISKDNKNLTQESTAKKMAVKLKGLPLDQALKIGDGKTVVVEFIDPNCHYCRLSFDFFKKRKKDVTLYVFFYPLSEDSQRKIRHIACSKDRAAAYDDALSGKLDAGAQLISCRDQATEDFLKSHQEISGRAGIRATPLFYIKGQVVPGFDQQTIETILAE